MFVIWNVRDAACEEAISCLPPWTEKRAVPPDLSITLPSISFYLRECCTLHTPCGVCDRPEANVTMPPMQRFPGQAPALFLQIPLLKRVSQILHVWTSRLTASRTAELLKCFPPEIILHILSMVDTDSYLAVKLTCKDFNRVLTASLSTNMRAET